MIRKDLYLLVFLLVKKVIYIVLYWNELDNFDMYLFDWVFKLKISNIKGVIIF